MLDDHRLQALLEEAELRASRSSGPGGQHANVTASRIEAVLDVEASEVLNGGQKARLTQKLGPRITAVSQDARSQARNREIALDRLGRKVQQALRVPRKRRPTKPTKASKQRRLDAKRQQSQRKQGRRRPADD